MAGNQARRWWLLWLICGQATPETGKWGCQGTLWWCPFACVHRFEGLCLSSHHGTAAAGAVEQIGQKPVVWVPRLHWHRAPNPGPPGVPASPQPRQSPGRSPHRPCSTTVYRCITRKSSTPNWSFCSHLQTLWGHFSPSWTIPTKMCVTKDKGDYHLQLEFTLILLQDSLVVRYLSSLPTSFQLGLSYNTSLIQPILGTNTTSYHHYLSTKWSKGRNLDL